jgi:hypothetical protein
LQLYYSTAGNSNNVGTTAGSATNTAGTFTNIVWDANPNMSNLNFPIRWGVITTTLTGITTPTVGRLAFRYYIPNGGAGGPNGYYIGFDEFRYSLPCPKPNFWGDVVSAPACLGAVIPLKIFPGQTNAPTSYTWFTGVTTSTAVMTPTIAGVMDIWSLGETTPGCVSLDISYVNVQVPPTVSYTINPGNVLCASTGVTVTASGANTYTYALGSTNSTVNPLALVSPTVANQATVGFTLTGKAANQCTHRQVVTLTVNPLPTVSVSVSKNVICVANTVALIASGASTYSWSGAVSSTANAVNYTAGNTAGTQQFTVYGTSPEGCRSTTVATTVSVSLCTGIESWDDAEAGIVYPNPFFSVLHFTGNTVSVEIYNQLGQNVFQSRADKIEVIDASHLPAGVYNIKTTSLKGTKRNAKIIKN